MRLNAGVVMIRAGDSPQEEVFSGQRWDGLARVRPDVRGGARCLGLNSHSRSEDRSGETDVCTFYCRPFLCRTICSGVNWDAVQLCDSTRGSARGVMGRSSSHSSSGNDQ